MKVSVTLMSLLAFTFIRNAHALLGTELAPLLQLVTGQVEEIQRLSEQVGLAKDQQRTLQELNAGIQRSVSQIQALQTIIERAQGLEPREMQSLADLNDLLANAKGVQVQVDELLETKLNITRQVIEKSTLQSDTTYRMGQEMISTGSVLAKESETASPGRAAQIAAASSSAQMLSQGIELQTLSQMVQIQTMQLELQKTQVERELRSEKIRSEGFRQSLAQSINKGTRKNNLKTRQSSRSRL